MALADLEKKMADVQKVVARAKALEDALAGEIVSAAIVFRTSETSSSLELELDKEEAKKYADAALEELKQEIDAELKTVSTAYDTTPLEAKEELNVIYAPGDAELKADAVVSGTNTTGGDPEVEDETGEDSVT